MKQNQIEELTKLNSENLENIFNVYQLENGMYFYNLLQTIHFPQNLPSSLFNAYTIEYGDTWPFISYKAYKNPNLWWVILLANNIQNPIISMPPGTIIGLPNIDVVKEVISQIRQSR